MASRAGSRSDSVAPEARNVRPRSGPWLPPLLRRAMAASGCSVDTAALERELLAQGATSQSDFVGIAPGEAQLIWAPLQALPLGFVREFIAVCALAESASALRRPSPPGGSVDAVSQPSVGARRPDTNAERRTEKAMAALALCSAARNNTCVPQPDILAEAIRALAAVDTMLFAPPVSAPRAEVARRAGLAGQDAFDKEALWLE